MNSINAKSVQLIELHAFAYCLLSVSLSESFDYLEFNFADVMPQMNVRQDSSLFAFYVYIALLALVLLGLDYWLRKKYIWK